MIRSIETLTRLSLYFKIYKYINKDLKNLAKPVKFLNPIGNALKAKNQGLGI